MPRLHALIAALSLFLAISYAQCMTWQSCEGSNSALNITSVSMQPDTPTHGQAMAFTVEAESDNDQVGYKGHSAAALPCQVGPLPARQVAIARWTYQPRP